jgi:hypothetical protein
MLSGVVGGGVCVPTSLACRAASGPRNRRVLRGHPPLVVSSTGRDWAPVSPERSSSICAGLAGCKCGFVASLSALHPLASTHRWKRRRHVEDGSLASLKTGPKNKRRQRRSRSRGLIDRDVCRGTPATTANVDSRLANRWSDRAGS